MRADQPSKIARPPPRKPLAPLFGSCCSQGSPLPCTTSTTLDARLTLSISRIPLPPLSNSRQGSPADESPTSISASCKRLEPLRGVASTPGATSMSGLPSAGRPLRAQSADASRRSSLIRHDWSPPVLRPARPLSEPGRSRAAAAIAAASSFAAATSAHVVPPAARAPLAVCAAPTPRTASASRGGHNTPRAASTLHEQSNVELLFDSILNCYYDPKTNKYFELR